MPKRHYQQEPQTYEQRTEPWDLPEGYVLHPLQPLPGETREAWDAFQIYRDLGVGRTMTEVARQIGKAQSAVMMRAARNRWKERVALFDKMVADEEHEAIRREADKHAREIFDRRKITSDRDWDNAEKIQKKLDLMFSYPTVRTEVSKDGKNITYIPYKWSGDTFVRLLEMESLLRRRASEMPTQYQQIDVNANTSQEISMAHLSPEERAAHEFAEREAAALYLQLRDQYLQSGGKPEAPALVARVDEPQPPAWYMPGEPPPPETEPEPEG